MRRVLALALAGAAYTVAAWAAAPGFYDGFQPVPYRWVNPPPKFARDNQQPGTGHLVIRIGPDGMSDPATAVTADPLNPQCQVTFVPGALVAPADRSAITVDIRPVAAFPSPPSGITFSTNVYLVTASQPLSKNADITLTYTDGQPAPSSVYTVEQNGTSWRDIGSAGNSPPFAISATSKTLGYFVAGYSSAQAPRGPVLGGGQTLPLLTALAIVIVVVAGVPLAILRRRRLAEQGEPHAQEADGDRAGGDSPSGL